MTAIAAAFCLLPVGISAGATSGDEAYAEPLRLLKLQVADVAAKVQPERFPVAVTAEGALIDAPGTDWNSGFWAGTLWRVYDLEKTPAARAAALAATRAHFGFERTLFHDLGFMYGESSVAAYRRICGRTPAAECSRLKRSGLTAAASLLKLSRTTGQRIMPMSAKRCSDCSKRDAETIVDSMMNLRLLYWAAHVSGNRAYRGLALRQANWVAANLQRRDGSTYQAGSYLRSAKRARVRRHTHQGRSNNGVWSRGQSWSIYGFADAAIEFKSKRFLKIAERNAAYLERRLPAAGVPPWDFRAGTNAPTDVSAGVIAAAGLFHLAAACDEFDRFCRNEARWERLARRVLTGSLANIRTSAPVGYLGGMVYKMAGAPAWQQDAELVFGLDYALEAIELARDD